MKRESLTRRLRTHESLLEVRSAVSRTCFVWAMAGISYRQIFLDGRAPQDPNPNPQAIRTSVMQAMVGHVRGKAAYIGLFRRPQ